MTIFCLVILLLLGAIYGDYTPPTVYGKGLWTDFIPLRQEEIEWGSGFSTLTLMETFNSATVPLKVKTRELRKEHFEVRACTSAGESLNFLSSPFSLPAAFLTHGNDQVESALRISSMTDLQSALVTKIEIMTGLMAVTKFELRKEPREDLENGRYARFLEFYGSHHLERATTGATLHMHLKFSCKSKSEKEALDWRLAQHAGIFSTPSQLLAELRAVQEKIAVEINVLSTGAEKPPPKLNLAGAIEFVEVFVREAGSSRSVTSLQYFSLLEVAGPGLKEYVLERQKAVDGLLAAVTTLKNVELATASLLERAPLDPSLSFLSKQGLEQLGQLRTEGKELETEIKREFNGGDTTLDKLTKRAAELPDRLERLITEERSFHIEKSFYLKSVGLARYMSIASDNYLTLTTNSPIQLRLLPVSGGAADGGQARYDGELFRIMPTLDPRFLLCMGSSSWYVYWVYREAAFDPMCSWTLRPVGAVEKFVRFSDTVQLVNRHWPEYAVGVSEDGAWVTAVETNQSATDSRYQWSIEKTPFKRTLSP